MRDEFGPVQIGPREIYDLGMATKRSVDVLTAEVRGLSGDLIDVKADLEDHEDRIRAVERSRWPISPANIVTAVVALLALAVEVIPKLAK